MMYKIKISNQLHRKPYFWYLYRCLTSSNLKNNVEVTTFENTFFKDEDYIELIFINEQPIIFDVRDDHSVSETYHNLFNNEYILFKANYSNELWDNPPENFPYRIQDWGYEIRGRIIPFAYGRSFSCSHDTNELSIYGNSINEIKYLLTSFSGPGLNDLQTFSRISTYNLLDDILKENAK